MAWTKQYHKSGDPVEGYYFDIGTFVCGGHFKDDFLNNHNSWKRKGSPSGLDYFGKKKFMDYYLKIIQNNP